MRNTTNRVKAKPCDPIESQEDINKLRDCMVRDNRNGARDSLLVTLGCNLGLRASDLCRLKVGDVLGKEHLDIVEQKTKKRRIIRINAKVVKSVECYVKYMQLTENKYLFPSQKGGFIQPKTLHKIIKKAAREVGIEGNIGSHSLRKTMGYHVFNNNYDKPNIIKEIMLMYNHSSVEVTKRYLSSSAVRDKMYSGIDL